MTVKRDVAPAGLVGDRDIDQSDDSVMSHLIDDGELAEVLVERDHHALVTSAGLEDLAIARVLGPAANPDGVMAQGPEAVAHASCDTGVDEDAAHRPPLVAWSISST